MLKNYLTIAWRNLVKNKLHSFINIAGLSIGMAVAMLIGLWVWDECSFNKNFAHYDRIAQVMQKQTFNGEVQVWSAVASPLGPVLRQHYGHDFAHVVRAGWTSKHLLEVRGDAVAGDVLRGDAVTGDAVKKDAVRGDAVKKDGVGEKIFSEDGNFMEPEATELLSLNMLKGTRAGLRDMNSILLSARLAKILFGDADPMDKMIRLDNRSVVKVTGVYEDMPYNSTFADLGFLAPWDLIWKNGDFEHILHNPWGASWFQTFAEIAPHADMQQVSHQIKNAKLDAITNEDEKRNKPEIILQPMHNWHLYGEFKNGVNVGGRIMYVWLFGTIGVFVLLLACINFMNLSTARSEKRAKEVGIRKSIGSGRGQLISQFFLESLLVVFFSFILSLLLVLLALPFFNQVADKKVTIPLASPWFWGAGTLFSLLTGLIAGSYPSFYLSSFRPVQVLKGTFKAGRLAALPRKILVVLQFTVSVTLIIGTVVVYRQVRFAKDRPVGYSRDGLVTMNAGGIGAHYAVFRAELIKTGMVADVAGNESDITNDYITNSGLSWQGKDPALQEEFVTNGVTADFGKTTGWQVVEGRDFSPAFTTDSTGIILNETAVKYMGFKHPIGEVVQWGKNRPVHVIGVVKDMITQNPYEPVKQSFFYLSGFLSNIFMGKITLRVNPREPMRAALASIESVYRKYSPDQPFSYAFADDEYAKKFNDEERIGHLASAFALLAIFISCLGLFGMAAFMAEQRTKEIGVRKVLGASVYNLWLLLSAEFVTLVVLSFLIASPLAYYLMHEWLQQYAYRSGLPVWIFAVAGGGAICITLLTVSFQSVKAALANPVKSLRTEG